jgi:hypothetical protein
MMELPTQPNREQLLSTAIPFFWTEVIEDPKSKQKTYQKVIATSVEEEEFTESGKLVVVFIEHDGPVPEGGQRRGGVRFFQ